MTKRADLTMHGSRNERRIGANAARMTNNDKKPNGFLSRNTKPASGRSGAHGKARPW